MAGAGVVLCSIRHSGRCARDTAIRRLLNWYCTDKARTQRHIDFMCGFCKGSAYRALVSVRRASSVCVCVCMCMCACASARACAHVHVRVRVRTCVRVRVCTRVYVLHSYHTASKRMLAGYLIGTSQHSCTWPHAACNQSAQDQSSA